MKHKDKAIELIKAFMFCALLLCLLFYTGKILERKESTRKMGGFFAQKENIDILLFGDSHIRDAVFPIELWNDYGITSYNLAAGRSTHAVNYWLLKNALDHVEPELVVIDCTLIYYDESKVYEASVMHAPIDEFPLSINKIKMMNDLFDDWDDRLSFLYKFSLYHSRWNELSEEDFKDRDSIIDKVNYGSERSINVSIPDTYPQLDKDDKLENDTINMEYLRKMIEECQANGIDVLLTYIPFPANEERQREANSVYDIASEYNVHYVNFLDMDVVNYNTDCYDPSSHLNASGGHKVTNFLGDYITKNYSITDHREDPAYQSWNDNYEDYLQNNLSELIEQRNLDDYLMLLADKNLSCCIYIDESMVDYLNADMNLKLSELIKNLSQYKSLEKFEAEGASGKKYFLIVDNGAEEVYESIDGAPLDIPNTTFGSARFGTDEAGRTYLYIRDGEKNCIDEKYAVTVVVIDKHTGIIEDVAGFIRFDKHLHYGIREEWKEWEE